MKEVAFDAQYYSAIMEQFGYNPLEFERISFSMGQFTKDDLQRQWLCHMNGRAFADRVHDGKRAIVTTGFGLSGVPHMGTLSQILRAIRLQRAGIPVQVVLGDLDAYNGKNIELEIALALSEKYKKYIRMLGFDNSEPNVLRSQYDSLSTLRLSYLIGRYMEDEMFDSAEEDLHDLYVREGKVDAGMSYRRKLSLNLMIADFLELLVDGDFEAIMVILGIDEHQYVNFGRLVFESLQREVGGKISDSIYSAMYSGIIRGFHGYPKMSKSFPGSGISVDMSQDQISDLILNGEEVTPYPATNVVYQMIASVSQYDNEKVMEAYLECERQSRRWRQIKEAYATHLYELCRLWHEH